jgi:uncharacterized membrane protein
MTSDDHNKYLAFAFLAHGAVQILWMIAMSLFFLFFFSSMPRGSGRDEFPLAVFLFFMGIMLLIQLIFSVPSFVAGYALLKRRQWARTAGIVGAVLAGASFPIGTAVCVYAFWFLLSDSGKSLYSSRNRNPENYGPPLSWQGYSPPSLWVDRSSEAVEGNNIPTESQDRRK